MSASQRVSRGFHRLAAFLAAITFVADVAIAGEIDRRMLRILARRLKPIYSDNAAIRDLYLRPTG